MVYLYISETSLDVFNCGKVVSETGVSDGKWYMNSEPSEVCYEEGSMQAMLQPWAIITTLVYSLGYPLLIIYLLFKPDHRKLIRQDQLLRACGTGDTPDNNPFCFNFRKRYGRLYYNFKPIYWYWIILTILRKFCIVSAALIFRDNPTFQLCVILLIMFGAYVVQTKYQPWMSNAEKAQVCTDHEEEIKIIEDRINTENKKKVKNYDEIGLGRSAGKRVVLGNKYVSRAATSKRARAAEFFWNYNTCESVLLCCAVVVAAMGVMFESQYLSSGSIEQETLSYLTLLTIGGSTLYYFVVMWTEIVGALVPELSCHFLSGGRLDDDEYYEDQIERPSQFEMASIRNVGAQIMEVENARLSDTGIGILSEDEQVKLKRVRQQLKDEKATLEASIAKLRGEARGGAGIGGGNLPQNNPLSARTVGGPEVEVFGSLDEPVEPVSATLVAEERSATAVPRKSAL